jgi:hypothetical protein
MSKLLAKIVQSTLCYEKTKAIHHLSFSSFTVLSINPTTPEEGCPSIFGININEKKLQQSTGDYVVRTRREQVEAQGETTSSRESWSIEGADRHGQGEMESSRLQALVGIGFLSIKCVEIEAGVRVQFVPHDVCGAWVGACTPLSHPPFG